MSGNGVFLSQIQLSYPRREKFSTAGFDLFVLELNACILGKRGISRRRKNEHALKIRLACTKVEDWIYFDSAFFAVFDRITQFAIYLLFDYSLMTTVTRCLIDRNS